MNISATGLALVKFFEGCKLTAYKCPAGVWTIGYGSTGPHVHEGLKITQERADELLREDLARFEKGVDDAVTVGMTQSQFDALVAFAFNVGLGNLRSSTLLKKVNAHLNQEAPDQFLRWNKAGGVVLAGLTKRRKAEAALYAGKDWRTA